MFDFHKKIIIIKMYVTKLRTDSLCVDSMGVTEIATSTCTRRTANGLKGWRQRHLIMSVWWRAPFISWPHASSFILRWLTGGRGTCWTGLETLMCLTRCSSPRSTSTPTSLHPVPTWVRQTPLVYFNLNVIRRTKRREIILNKLTKFTVV